MKLKFFTLFVALLMLGSSCQSTEQSRLGATNLSAKGSSASRQTANSGENCTLEQGSAVIFMYHRFNEPYKSTSVTTQQLKEQFEFLKNNGYKVVPLSQVVLALRGEVPFGEKWVALTIDDAYKSFLQALPLFEEYDYPYTLFVNTEAVDQQLPSAMTWSDIQSLASSDLSDLGAHTHSHGYLIRDMSPAEREKDILLSVEKIYQNTSVMPQFFAYPFGEVSDNLKAEIQKTFQVAGQEFWFSAAFSTQSGPVGCSSDMFSLPRFALNENYGKVDDLFAIKAHSRHLPVYDYQPKNKSICIEAGVTTMYFSTSSDIDLTNMNCFASRGNTVNVNSAGDGMVKLTLGQALGFGVSNPRDLRERVNCTAFYKGRYFWYGREFTILQQSSECTSP